MDSGFFVASKLIWALLSPDSLIVLLGVGAWAAMAIGWNKLSRRLMALCALLLLLIGFLPVGEWLIAPLENRFASSPALPQSVDGIIVLGGAIDPPKSQAWLQPELNAAADRLTNFLYLARLYPTAQLVFTGGSGLLTEQDYKEAETAQTLFQQMGLAERAIIFESNSRNTAENVENSLALLTPKSGEEWLMVTSAYHVPRAVAVFCKNGWPVQPYPVDHYSKKGELLRVEFSFANNLEILRIAMREWAGLIAYRLSGRTEQLLPSQDNYCGIDQASL